MGETHGRGMEGGWNTADAWPVPVECLLNGISSPAETHLMFGGHLLQHQFRNRFQGAPLQLGPSPHLVVESSVSGDSTGQASVSRGNPEGAQDGLVQSIPLRDDVLEDGDESSEEEEEMGDSLVQNGLSMGHSIGEEGLVQVQCGESVPVGAEALVHQQLPMSGDPNCHHQKLMEHPLQSHPHAPPMNPIFFQEQEFEAPPVEEANDPNTGFSVYGKLYYEREGRVVLHLKQWLEPPDSGGMTFGPTGEAESLHDKNHLLQGCALCRLRATTSQQYRAQKQAHRHTFRGVLFTFEECMIVELYPEDANVLHHSHNGLKPSGPEGKLVQRQSTPSEAMGIPSYMDRSLPSRVEAQLGTEELMEHQQHMGLDPLGVPAQQPLPPDKSDAHKEWWDEFESDEGGGDELKEQEDSSELSDDGEAAPSPLRPEDMQSSSCLSHRQDQEEASFPEQPTFLPREESGDDEEKSQLENLILRDPLPTTHQLDNLATPTIQNAEVEEEPELVYSMPEENEGLRSISSPLESPPLKKTLKCNLGTTEEQGRPLYTRDAPTERLGKKGRRVKYAGGSHNPTQLPSPGTAGFRTERVGPAREQRRKAHSGHKFRHRKNLRESHSPKKSILSCNICGKNFTVLRRLETHRLAHGTEKSSQCEKCGKRFARKDKLVRHMYVHSEEKMFGCSVCEKRFSRRDKLADHLKSHGGPDETHHCPLCQKEFLRPDILKQHLKLHAMGNKHQCNQCLRFVTGRDRLDQHMARHEEARAQGQDLLCPLCTKAFIQRHGLKAHFKKFHPTAHLRLLAGLFPDQGDGRQEEDESPKARRNHALRHQSKYNRQNTNPRKQRRKLNGQTKVKDAESVLRLEDSADPSSHPKVPFTSEASPASATGSPIREPTPAHCARRTTPPPPQHILSLSQLSQAGHETQFQISQPPAPHNSISITTNGISSPQSPLQHLHAHTIHPLLHTTLPLTQAQIHPHLHVGHHVSLSTQQTLCPPYLIYPHYYQ